jgi:hypothetical protein
MPIVSGLFNTDAMNFVECPKCDQPAGKVCIGTYQAAAGGKQMNQPLNDIAEAKQEERTSLESKFHQRMLRILEMEPKLGLRSTRFQRMVYEHDGVWTARTLLKSDPPPNTFGFLRERKRLDLAMEYYVVPPGLRPEVIRALPMTADDLTDYSSLFDKDEQAIASWRLHNVI